VAESSRVKWQGGPNGDEQGKNPEGGQGQVTQARPTGKCVPVSPLTRCVTSRENFLMLDCKGRPVEVFSHHWENFCGLNWQTANILIYPPRPSQDNAVISGMPHIILAPPRELMLL